MNRGFSAYVRSLEIVQKASLQELTSIYVAQREARHSAASP